MKMTRKQYNQEKANLNKRLAEVQAILAQAKATNGESLVDIDDWDEYHDEEWRINNDLKMLEISWGRRNWTASDYATQSLVAQNID